MIGTAVGLKSARRLSRNIADSYAGRKLSLDLHLDHCSVKLCTVGDEAKPQAV